MKIIVDKMPYHIDDCIYAEKLLNGELYHCKWNGMCKRCECYDNDKKVVACPYFTQHTEIIKATERIRR